MPGPPVFRLLDRLLCHDQCPLHENLFIGNLVGKTDLFCLPGVYRLSGEDHFQRVRETDKPRQTLRASEAGNDAEFYFGKGQGCFLLVAHEPIGAGEGKLHPAAHAGTVDGSHGRKGQGFQLIENRLALAGEPLAGFSVRDVPYFCDVRTDYEIPILVAPDDEGFDLFPRGKFVEQGAELIHCRSCELVYLFPREVEGKDSNAVGIYFIREG